MSVNYSGRARVAGELGESVGLVGSWREMREVGERTKGAFFSGDPKSPLRRREKKWSGNSILLKSTLSRSTNYT